MPVCQELGARVPIIIRAPHMRGGVVSNLLVESVDLYPTIASLAGLPPPGDDLDGVDLSPLFHDPDTPLKPNVAFSEYPRCAPPETPWDDRSSCVKTERKNFNVMGLSVRVPEWRYTAWMLWNGTLLVPDFGREPVGVELYEHAGDTEADFDMYENVNVAADPAHKATVAELHAMAVKQWSKGGCEDGQRPCVCTGGSGCKNGLRCC
jgi:iduronate 2-sulfatase